MISFKEWRESILPPPPLPPNPEDSASQRAIKNPTELDQLARAVQRLKDMGISTDQLKPGPVRLPKPKALSHDYQRLRKKMREIQARHDTEKRVKPWE